MTESLILNIESSTEVCSVSLGNNGKLIGLKETDEPRSHSRLATVFVRELMKEAGMGLEMLSGVSVAIGPGSYTGLRVGLSIAKGICYAQNIPLITMDSLDIIAELNKDELSSDYLIIPMIDARRMEVYAKVIENNHKTVVSTHAHIITDKSFNDLRHKPWLLCGDGASKSIETLANEDIKLGKTNTSSSGMVKLSYEKYIAKDFADLAYSRPNYLKSPNITTSKKFSLGN